MPIRKVLKVVLLIALVAGVSVGGPAMSQGWFTWNAAKKTAQHQLYVAPGQNKPKRTWSEYLFGKNAEQNDNVLYNRKGYIPSHKNEKKISDYEVHTTKDQLERGRQLTLAHQVGLMKLQAQTRGDIAEADRKHRMLMIELQSQSRRATDAAMQADGIGSVSMPEGNKKVIYNTPGTVKPQKVFTDYQ